MTNPKQFIFKNYLYDASQGKAIFRYAYDNGLEFEEAIHLSPVTGQYNERVMEKAMQLAFMLIGTSYVKLFPSIDVKYDFALDIWQAQFMNIVYQEGLSQFAFENNLGRGELPKFMPNIDAVKGPLHYEGSGIISLQSGGKDSLLVASLLRKARIEFDSLFVSSTSQYPNVIDAIGQAVLLIKRKIDISGIQSARDIGGLNGHVPVTYIVLSIALLQAVVSNKNTILVAIGREGEEPHGRVGDLPITHQWSKTWYAEQQFAEYIKRYISADLRVGSPLRRFSELKIAELFVQHSWRQYGNLFSSCNIGNYMQGAGNESLTWCGNCPKCANSFLLFAPFVKPDELRAVFNGQNLFSKAELAPTFKGLLGIDGYQKPFECIGEIPELRTAYYMAQHNWGANAYSLPFDVPQSDFNYNALSEDQAWARDLISDAL